MLAVLAESVPVIQTIPSFWSISLGQVIIGAPITVIMVLMVRMHGMLLMFRMEHEILMQDWAARQVPPKTLHELHTRQRKWW